MDFNYDPESDVMAIKLVKKPQIAYAEELGDVVVHFNPKDKPVYLEILNSKAFFKQAVVNLPQEEANRYSTSRLAATPKSKFLST